MLAVAASRVVSNQDESIVWRRFSDQPGLELLIVHNCCRLWTVWHQTYTFCVVVDHGGLTDWVYRRRHYPMYARTVSFMEPGEVHRNIKHTAAANFFVVQVDPAEVARVAAEEGLPLDPHLTGAVSEHPRLYAKFCALYRALARAAPLMERESLLLNALHSALALYGERRPPEISDAGTKGLDRARSYLAESYAEPLTLADLARVAAMSRFHFVRSFAARFGLPPHAYLNQVRVARARELLKEGLQPAELDVGFVDQSHLIRHFKRINGVTPGAYRAAL